MYCSNCGKSIPEDANMCPYCGNQIKGEAHNDKPKEKIHYVSSKSRLVSGILCALGLLGLAGIHRMYVGKWKTGLLYAATFGVVFLGTLYDIYQIYYESFKDTDGYPLCDPSSIKRNYKKRTPKGDTNVLVKIIAVLFLFSAFGNLMIVITGPHQKAQNSSIAQNEQNNKTESKGNKKENKPNTKKNQETELELVEKVKENYYNNRYLDANSALVRLKNLYPDSRYISALERDYPDLSEKAAVAKEESARKWKESLDAFNTEMSNGPGANIYEGYALQQGGIKFCVYANSNWHSLSEGQKKAFTEIAYATYSKYGLNAPNFYIVNVNNNRNLAHYPGVFGGVALDD